MKRLLLAGGGTGGHLYPAMAVGQAWRQRYGDDAELLFVGTADRIEATAVPRAGERLETIDITGIVGLSGWRKVLGLLRLPRALFQAVGIIRNFRPDVVLGAGGFASGPTVAAAWLMGYPTAILEQNSMPGVTNRILGKLVRRVYTQFQATAPWFAARKVRRVGNPVRLDQSQPDRDREVASEAKINLLVLGGSQGAQALNEGLPAAIAAMPEALQMQLNIVHQAGPKRDLKPIEEAYGQTRAKAAVLPFLDDMPERYNWSDLCVCRAGAMTVTELAVAGRGAIFIPFPLATHDHQRHNAQELVDEGAARLVDQRNLDPQLKDTLEALTQDPEALRTMAKAARTHGRPEAARVVAEELAELAGLER